MACIARRNGAGADDRLLEDANRRLLAELQEDANRRLLAELQEDANRRLLAELQEDARLTIAFVVPGQTTTSIVQSSPAPRRAVGAGA